MYIFGPAHFINDPISYPIATQDYDANINDSPIMDCLSDFSRLRESRYELLSQSVSSFQGFLPRLSFIEK